MPRRTPTMPVLSDATVQRLLAHPKPISDPDWARELERGSSEPMCTQARFDLREIETGPIRGSLHLYMRQGRSGAEGDWSVGLIFTPIGTVRHYPLLRCNGPHETVHTNTIEGTSIIRTPHIHLLTERYQLIGKVNSGYAEPTDRFTTVREALGTLQEMGHLVGDGILLFPPASPGAR